MFSIPNNQSFALFEKEEIVTLYTGVIQHLQTLDELQDLQEQHAHIVFVNPYHTIKEKGFRAHGDEPIKVLIVEQTETLSRSELLQNLPDTEKLITTEIIPSLSDEVFEQQVETVIKKEIEGGNAVQVVLSRYFTSQLTTPSQEQILSLYKRLLEQRGQYMTILFYDHTDKQTILGATPERHVEISDTTITMNPIAGTYIKQNKDVFSTEMKTFLQDKKEINELFQVLDEELKMMAYLCPEGGTVAGPVLREIGSVVHTEYVLTGQRNLSMPMMDIFRQTLHAPTLVGGPLQSAARIITQYETKSRRYYGGQIGIIKDNTLDCAILIRCAEVDAEGTIRVQGGAGIVKDSIPENEQKETRAKANGFLRSLSASTPPEQMLSVKIEQELDPLLKERNEHVSRFLCKPQIIQRIHSPLVGKTALIINNEDNFAFVLAHFLQHMGLKVHIQDTFDVNPSTIDTDYVIIGPGPGDINDKAHPRMKKLHDIVTILDDQKQPMLGICLGHQALSRHYGTPVEQLKECTQGIQRDINVFGNAQRVGFYNSFAPHKDNTPILTFKQDHAIGLQFHPESVLTVHGYDILTECFHKLSA